MRKILAALILVLALALPSMATVSDTESPVKIYSTGTATEYTIPFDYISDSDIVVTLVNATTGAETAQTLDVDYTIVSDTVTYSSAPGAGYKVVIQRVTPYTQEASFSAGEAPPLTTYESAFDKLTYLVQDLNERVSRAPLLTESSSLRDLELPDPASNGGKYLKVNAAGTAIEADALTSGSVSFNLAKLSDYASLPAMLTAISTEETTVIVDTTGTLTANTVIPSTMHLIIHKGGQIATAGYTLTINGPFEAPIMQVFSGFASGDIVFGSPARAVYPEWFGASRNGTADDSTAINSAITSLGTSHGEVVLQAGTYGLNAYVAPDSYITLRGVPGLSVLKHLDSADFTGGVINFTEENYVTIRDLVVDGNIAGRSSLTYQVGGIFCTASQHCLIENVVFQDLGQCDGTAGGNAFTFSVLETSAQDCAYNVVRGCYFNDSSGQASFGVRAYTDYTSTTASDAFTTFTRDNVIENNTFVGYAWNAIELCGPATVHNTVRGNVSTGLLGYTGFESDKGASYNLFEGNVVRDTTDAKTSVHAFRDQGEPANGSQPERFAQFNTYINNTVLNMEEADTVCAGFYFYRSIGCTVIGHRVIGINGTGSTFAAFYVNTAKDLTIKDSQVSDVQTGIYCVGGAVQDGLTVTGGTYEVNGLFYRAGSVGTKTRFMFSGINIKCGTDGFYLLDEPVSISSCFISGAGGSTTGVAGNASGASGTITGNFISAFATGITLSQDTMAAVGNAFSSCTANITVTAGKRVVDIGNISSGSGTATPCITWGTAAPGSGTFLKGDICMNSSPDAGEFTGWLCTSAGSPGTWKGFGVIETP